MRTSPRATTGLARGRSPTLALVVLVAAGCNAPGSELDAYLAPDTAAHDAGTDALTDANVPMPPLTLAGGSAASLACVGHQTLPPVGPDAVGSVIATEFLTNAPLAGQTIEIFVNDHVSATCAAPTCASATTDSSGRATLTLATGPFAYRLPAGAGTVLTVGYARNWPGSGPQGTFGFAHSTVTAECALVRRDFDPAAGEMVGVASDCAAAGLANVRVRLYRDGVEVVSGPASDRRSTRITGLNGTSPTPSGLTGDGNFAAANLPPGHYVVETIGVRAVGSAPELIGCEEGDVFASGVTVMFLRPLRTDYAVGSGCASPPAP